MLYALLTDVFNQRPPLPHYIFVWDVEIVLIYLKTNMSDNSKLSDKDLTNKTYTYFITKTLPKRVSINCCNALERRWGIVIRVG